MAFARWALVLTAFALSILVSHRAVENIPNDLRRWPILLLNALAATVVALGFAAHKHSFKRWTDAQSCLRFGIWAAAVFRLLPPMMNEDVLYFQNVGTFDVPYVVLGACVHGGLAVLVASPFAMSAPEGSAWMGDTDRLQMCGAAILVLFIIACTVRLLSEHWW